MTRSSSNLGSYFNANIVSKRSQYDAYLSSFGKFNMAEKKDPQNDSSSIMQVIDSVHTDMESEGSHNTGKNTPDLSSSKFSEKRG